MGNLGKIIVATGSEKCNKLPNLVTLPVSYKNIVAKWLISSPQDLILKAQIVLKIYALLIGWKI